MNNTTINSVVFVSNYFNHHQKPFSDYLSQKLDHGYCFIETEPITEERKNMGWGREEKPSYVKNNYSTDHDRMECQTLIDQAQIVIFGSAPYTLIQNRLKQGKITFIYSERLYKQKPKFYRYPIHFLKFWKKYGRYRNVYCLCASAYAAADYAKMLTFFNKTYQWGYFPAFHKYDDIDSLIENKKKATILWVSRFIPLKHPEVPIEMAKRLKEEGYHFSMELIGTGPQQQEILEQIKREKLSDFVCVYDSMTPEEVRNHMEKSEIFLFTSDRNEGWGAVLNESMNSGCTIIASHAIGSVPFLIEDTQNGLIYKDGDNDDLYEKVKWVLDHPIEQKRIGKNAYQTIQKEWNAQNAAEKFLKLAEKLMGSNTSFSLDEGVCSRAKILKDNWR